MICTITRWMVSRSHDTGKSMARMAVRHLVHCGKCGDFDASIQSLDAGLRRDAQKILRKDGDGLDNKIISALPAASGPRRVPRRRFMPMPAMAAALVVVVAAAVLLLQVGPGQVPEQGEDPTLQILGSIDTHYILQDFATRVESPIETELRGLEQAVKSAAQSLLSGLDMTSTTGEPQS